MPKNVQTTVQQILFSWFKNHWGWWLQPWNNPRQHIKKQRYHFVAKDPSCQSYGFPSKHVRMWELNNQEAWMPKSWYFWIVVLEKTIESSVDSKEIKLVNPKGNWPWVFIGRSNAEAETPILWKPGVKSQHTGKDPDAGKDLRQKEKAVAEDGRLDCITHSMDMNLSKLGDMKDRGDCPIGLQSWTRLCDWKITLIFKCSFFILCLEFLLPHIPKVYVFFSHSSLKWFSLIKFPFNGILVLSIKKKKKTIFTTSVLVLTTLALKIFWKLLNTALALMK